MNVINLGAIDLVERKGPLNSIEHEYKNFQFITLTSNSDLAQLDRASGCPVYSAGAKNAVPRVGGSTPTFAEFFCSRFCQDLAEFGRKRLIVENLECLPFFLHFQSSKKDEIDNFTRGR